MAEGWGAGTLNIIIIVVGILAGALGALLGLGGGVVMLPTIQLLLDINTTTAIGTTLFAVIFTSAAGAWGHFRQGNVIWKAALLIGAGGLLGVYGGSLVFKNYLSVNTYLLELLLGLIFLFMAYRMGREAYNEWKGKTDASSGTALLTGRGQMLGLVALGLFTGTFSGIMGLGGGFIMVPVMLWFFGASPYQAVGTTLMAMLPIAAMGGMIKLEQGYVNLSVGLILGVGTIIGTQLGVALSPHIRPTWFKLSFFLIFLYLAAYYFKSLF